MVAADIVAMAPAEGARQDVSAQNKAIVRRQHEHAEELPLGYSDLSRFEIVEIKV